MKNLIPLALLSFFTFACGSDDPKTADAAVDGPATGADVGGTGTDARDGAATGTDTAAPTGDAPAMEVARDGASGDGTTPGDVPARTDGSPDAPTTASATIGPMGGTLSGAGGVQLIVNPGALAQNTVLTVSVVTSGYPTLPAGDKLASPVVALEPHGQVLTGMPSLLTIVHTAGMNPTTRLITASPGGSWSAITGATIRSSTVQAMITKFSFFAVTTSAAPDGGASDVAPAVDAATPDVAAGGTTHSVKVLGEVMSFKPEGLSIKPGDTVTWTWEANGHSVRSGGMGGTTPADCMSDGKFNSGAKNISDTFSFTFTTAGSYGYHCAAHCAQFEGGIITVGP